MACFTYVTIFSSHISEHIGNHTIIKYTLPKIDTTNIDTLIKNINLDPYTNWKEYCPIAQQIVVDHIPEELKNIILSMRNNNYPTVLIVRNMPIDTYIPTTPLHGNRPPYLQYNPDGTKIHNILAKGFVSETMLLGICSLLNAYPDFDEREKDGTYINQVIPLDDENYKHTASSFGSEVAFLPHTENVYQEPPLKFFALLCLRGNSQVATTLIYLDSILEYIQENPLPTMSYEQIVEQMRKPQFIMKTGPSFKDHVIEKTLPILTTNNHNERIFRFNANEDRVIGITAEAKIIVQYLKDVLTSKHFKDQKITQIYLQAGDFVLFNNWEVMHARDAFKVDKENRRWLQRCYFMLNDN